MGRVDATSVVVAAAALEFTAADPARMTAFLAWCEQRTAGIGVLPSAEFEAGVQRAFQQLRQVAIENGGL